MAISDVGTALGHRYDGARVNAPCEQCASDHYAATGRFVTFLTCQHDAGDDE